MNLAKRKLNARQNSTSKSHAQCRNGSENMNSNMPDDRTKEGRLDSIKRMQDAATNFYGAAVYTGVHAFIEFTGLMNEFIKLCIDAEKQGIDWIHANVHGEIHLPWKMHHIEYLSEKLECIYGVKLQPPSKL